MQINLDVFVDEDQVGDKSRLAVKDSILLNLRGTPVDDMVFALQGSSKTFKRSGLLEYVFAGEIQKIESSKSLSRAGELWQQILLDCNVPITLDYYGTQPLVVRSQSDSHMVECSPGLRIGGIMAVKAGISFVHPRWIYKTIPGKVLDLQIVRVDEEGVFNFDRVSSHDSQSSREEGMIGLLLRVALEALATAS